MERTILAPGVAINTQPAQKFNRCRISIQFQYGATRPEATAQALLPLVLERCYAGCPDMTQLSCKLAQLYGADLSVDLIGSGAKRMLTVRISGIKDEFALEGEALTREYAAIALGVAFDPYLVNGVFAPEAVEIEKEKLSRQLVSEINDKRLYCVRQARRQFFGAEPAGIQKDGYLDEVAGITPQELTRVYREMLRTANIEVMVLGTDPAPVQELLQKALSGVQRAPVGLPVPTAQPVQPVQRFEEKMDLVQAKLCMLFTAGTPNTVEQMAVCRLAMSLFGGSSTSRLFLNVREKQSLCYYCGSSYLLAAGYMMVDSGVEPENAARAEQAILHELELLCSGPIQDEELEDCRRGLLSGMTSVTDTLGGTEGWYALELLRGGPVQSPQEAQEALRRVTKEEVQDFLRGLTHSVSYLVTKEDASHA